MTTGASQDLIQSEGARDFINQMSIHKEESMSLTKSENPDLVN